MGPIGGSRRPPQPQDTWGQVPSLVPSGTELRWAGREAASPECPCASSIEKGVSASDSVLTSCPDTCLSPSGGRIKGPRGTNSLLGCC